MPTSSRRLLFVALLSGGGAGLIGYGSGMYSRPEAGPGKPSTVRQELEMGGESAKLESHRQVFEQRYALKDKAVRELLRGHQTLVQAAVRFRDIERDLPVPWGPVPPSAISGEDERLCREVITRARHWVWANLPAEMASVVARLEAELEWVRGPDGAVHLPEQ